MKFLILFAVMGLGMVASALNPASRRQGVAFFAGWFVPGVGHVIMGRWVKGLAIFGLLGAAYVTGLCLCGWRTVAFEDNPFYYVGQFGSGVTTWLGQTLSNPKAYPPVDKFPPSWFDGGMLYVCVAGLLNLVVMMSVFDVKKAAVPAPPPVPAPVAQETPK